MWLLHNNKSTQQSGPLVEESAIPFQELRPIVEKNMNAKIKMSPVQYRLISNELLNEMNITMSTFWCITFREVALF